MCLIYSYTREQALQDGELVDVTKTAKEAGFPYPTALTKTVWDQYVEVPDGVSDQDEAGRLRHILWVLLVEMYLADPKENEVIFQIYVRNAEEKKDFVALKAVRGPGDRGETVITIMLPNED